jgi:LysR family transcriptional activator of nhaA
MIEVMDWLNYHHLLYFWTVVREGGITNASRHLRLAQPTVTGQVRALELALGEKLLSRSGRRLVPTEVGRLVYRYANEIFTLGNELTDVLKGRPPGRPLRLVVGVSDVLPKLVAHRLLQPALSLPEKVHVICYENQSDRLMAELATFGLDLILSDAPVGAGMRVRAFNHLLGSCGVTFFASPALAAKYRKNFPRSLDGAPFLLPLTNATLRSSLEQWFEAQGVHPQTVGEFQDSALMKVFGEAGTGIFTAPSIVEHDVRRHYRVSALGRTDAIVERFYAITIERRLKHPAVVAISEAARQTLFGHNP